MICRPNAESAVQMSQLSGSSDVLTQCANPKGEKNGKKNKMKMKK